MGRFLGVELGHTPIVKEFATAHGVTEMGAPVVGFVDVSHGGGYAAFCHHGVRFAEERFADEGDARALRDGFECGAKSGAACADDQNIMFMGFVGSGHRIRMSLKAPEASIRM